MLLAAERGAVGVFDLDPIVFVIAAVIAAGLFLGWRGGMRD